MTEKLRGRQDCYHFPKKMFIYWKPKKTEENAKNILKSVHCTALLMH